MLARHQHGELVAFAQFAEIELPLQRLDHRIDFVTAQPGVAGAADEAAVDPAADHVVAPFTLLRLFRLFEAVADAVIGAGFAAETSCQLLQIARIIDGPRQLLADLQITQIAVLRSQQGDIRHIDAILRQNAAEGVAGGNDIFMHAIVAGIFLIQLILRDFVIGGGLVGINRFTGFRAMTASGWILTRRSWQWGCVLGGKQKAAKQRRPM